MGRALLTLVIVFAACAPRVNPPEDRRASFAPSNADARISFWEERLHRDPEDSTPAKQLAAAYLSRARATGDFSGYLKAESVLSEVAGPNADYSVLTLLAAAKAAQHKFRDAVELAERARALDPQEATAYAVLADAQAELGELERAKESIAKLESIEPGFQALTRLANVALAEGDIQGSVRHLQKALADAVNRGLPVTDIAWTHIRLGVIHFDTGRYDVAERHYQAALALTPQSYLALEHLAELRAAQGRNEEALATYQQVIDIAPTPEFFEAIGEVYEALGRRSESSKWLKDAESLALTHLERGDIGYYRFLSEYYSTVALQPEKAVSYAERDVAVRGDAHTYATLAWANYRASRLPAAKEALEKALVTGIREAELFCRAATIYRASGDQQRAERYRADALALNPTVSAEDCSDPSAA